MQLGRVECILIGEDADKVCYCSIRSTEYLILVWGADLAAQSVALQR